MPWLKYLKFNLTRILIVLFYGKVYGFKKLRRWRMKMKTLVWAILACFTMGLFLISCNKPTDELDRAEKALQAARDAGALENAADQYASAEDKLNEGKNLMDKRSYSEARDALIEAAQLAELARQASLESQGLEAVTTAPTPVVPRVERPALSSSHVVVKGECLWWISEYKQVYNDPFQWPLIYQANRDQIKDPDLIYPDQVFRVPKDTTLNEIKKARKSAGAPRPYLPPGY
jgi:LysM repeat protein